MRILILLLLVSCVSKREVDAKIWLNNLPIPQEICEQAPAMKDYGFYRRLNSGNFEFVSVCNKASKEFLEMTKKDFNRIMNRVNNPDDSKKAIEILDPREFGEARESVAPSEARRENRSSEKDSIGN